MNLLSRAEEFCLLSVRMHDGEAYGASVRNHLVDATETDWSIGVVYQTLDRLARKGFLSTSIGDPTPERGGRSKRYYALTRKGLQALVLSREVQQNMWQNLDEIGLSLPSPNEIR